MSEQSRRTGDRAEGDTGAGDAQLAISRPEAPAAWPSPTIGAEAAVSADDAPFSMAEAKQLWSFLDGAIMDVHVRRQLWRTWGLCPRHAWGYAVAEIEVRGGRPFSTAILYEDLIGRAAGLIGSRALPWRLVLARLRTRGTCFTCDYIALARSHTDTGLKGVLARMNNRHRTTALLTASRTEWRARACPECLNGEGPVCRPHLLAGVRPPVGRRWLAGALWDLQRRLHVLVRSMTWQGPVAGTAEGASWVEALAWFGGWRFLRLGARSHAET